MYDVFTLERNKDGWFKMGTFSTVSSDGMHGQSISWGKDVTDKYKMDFDIDYEKETITFWGKKK